MIIQRGMEPFIDTAHFLNLDIMTHKLEGALHKAWLGYVIAKDKEEYDNQIKYASIIQKLQKELGIEVSSFPQLDIFFR